MKWNTCEVYTASRSLHPKKEQTPKRVKNTGYKINLDFDVIYTRHMLIIYLKIIYLLFFFYKTEFCTWSTDNYTVQSFGFDNMDDCDV